MRKQVDKVNQSPAAERVFDAIHTVMHLYRSGRSQAFRDDEHGVTHMESRVLNYFAHHPGATQKDLAAHSGRDKAQLTRLVRGLRDGGYLESKADVTDRRSTCLQLSPQGQALHAELMKSGAQILERAVEGLSAQQCEELVQLMEIIQTNLENGR